MSEPQRSQSVFDAAGAGATALAIYAAVETLFLDLLPWIGRANFVAVDRVFTVLLVAVYLLAGAAGAAVLASAARLAGHRLPARETGTAVLLLFYSAALIRSGADALRSTRGAMAVLCLGIVLVATFWDRARRRLAVLTNPWTVSLLLLAPWEARDMLRVSSRAHQALVLAVTAAAAIGLMAILIRLPGALARRAGATLVVAVMIFSVARPDPMPAEVKGLRRVPQQGANVLLVTLDTVRADRLSLYGHSRDTTPQLRQFARSATVYRRAIAPSNMTLATHASIFTGRSATEHGAHYDAGLPGGSPLSAAVPTLAEIYSRRGYATSAVVGNFGYLGAGFGLDRGFLHVDARTRRASTSTEPRHSMRSLFRGLARLAAPSRWPRNDRSARTADQITDAAIDRIDAARRERRPYFLFVNYFDAHDRIFVPRPYQMRFGEVDSDAAASVFETLTTESLKSGSIRVPAAAEQQLFMAYDQAVAFADAELGRLLRHVSTSGSQDRTLIVITSDHGESFGDHGLMAHGTSLYDSQVHVPLVVRLPGQTHGRAVDRPVSLTDLFPLLALTASEIRTGDVVSEAFPMLDHGVPGRRSGRALLRGRYKLIRPIRGPLELYDVLADPAESRNRAAEPHFRALAAEMSTALDAWLASRSVAGRNPTVLDPEAAARLRALGYLR